MIIRALVPIVYSYNKIDIDRVKKGGNRRNNQQMTLYIGLYMMLLENEKKNKTKKGLNYEFNDNNTNQIRTRPYMYVQL